MRECSEDLRRPGERYRHTMSKWSDPGAWARMCSGETCVICRQGRPAGVIAELEGSFVTVGVDAPLKGCCCLVLKRHAVELHDLTEAEGAAYMRDLQRVSMAVKAVTRAVKLNYEIHGNTIPHLHTHVYPRHVGDPFENRPIDPRTVTKPVYGPGEFEEFVERLQRALATAR